MTSSFNDIVGRKNPAKPNDATTVCSEVWLYELLGVPCFFSVCFFCLFVCFCLFFSFLGYLTCTEVEILVNRAALNFGVLVSCRCLVFPSNMPLSGSALCSVALFFRCFWKHHTLLQSGRWRLTFRPSA